MDRQAGCKVYTIAKFPATQPTSPKDDMSGLVPRKQTQFLNRSVPPSIGTAAGDARMSRGGTAPWPLLDGAEFVPPPAKLSQLGTSASSFYRPALPLHGSPFIHPCTTNRQRYHARRWEEEEEGEGLPVVLRQARGQDQVAPACSCLSTVDTASPKLIQVSKRKTRNRIVGSCRSSKDGPFCT